MLSDTTIVELGASPETVTVPSVPVISGAAVGPDDGTYYTDKAGEIVLDGIEPGTTVIAREIKSQYRPSR